MSKTNTDKSELMQRIVEGWTKKRLEEETTMCAKRPLTEEEINRDMIIGKWFFAWTRETGPCPIGMMNEYWYQKLCALFEWIAVLEKNESENHL
jgi:hypothetical protein